MTLLHATCIDIQGKGILIMGPSGSGKSDLALRMIGRGAILVSDDYVEISEEEAGNLIAHTAPNIAGKIEVRGVGLVDVAYRETTIPEFVVQLLPQGEVSQIERLPEDYFFEIEGHSLPCLKFNAFEASAVDKLFAVLGVYGA